MIEHIIIYREAVRNLCSRFGDGYWQEKDRERKYPIEFVSELTKSGFLSALIPVEYGGQGLSISHACAIMEEVIIIIIIIYYLNFILKNKDPKKWM